MDKRSRWQLRSRELLVGDRTLLMGVLNVTPDSFSDGGRYADPDHAFHRALELEDEGADILDIGAESTRPGSSRLSEAEELRRLVPVLKRLKGRLAIPISVDTYKSGVAVKAIEYGAEIINDSSGLQFDQQLVRVVAKHNSGLVINHMRGTPETWAKLPPLPQLMRALVMELDAAFHRAQQAGVSRTRIAIDPGLGFGKRKEQNSEIIARLRLLRSFEVPILIGPSRKSFLQQQTEESADWATAAAVSACVLGGAHIVRVHNVKAMRTVVQVVDAIRHAAEQEEAAVR